MSPVGPVIKIKLGIMRGRGAKGRRARLTGSMKFEVTEWRRMTVIFFPVSSPTFPSFSLSLPFLFLFSFAIWFWTSSPMSTATCSSVWPLFYNNHDNSNLKTSTICLVLLRHTHVDHPTAHIHKHTRARHKNKNLLTPLTNIIGSRYCNWKTVPHNMERRCELKLGHSPVKLSAR